ncbi:LlaJI family restriction endonuclease [Catenibacterium sp.]|uniref:LlaJI family restriction endonuclease n=1 Tax=Catenibacterium sp. TaxID=2049022 RepID=UPI003AB38329
MNKDVKIVPVDKSNSFVGIRIDEGIVKVFVPRVFREDEDWKKDIRLFLKSIEIAKTKNTENINKGSNNTDNAWPIDSYLWLINDYLENGLYYNREKKISRSNSGKIEWKRTLQQVPIYSDGNIIYDQLITSKMTPANDMITHIYKLCLRQSIDKIGWLFNYNFHIQIDQIVSIKEMIMRVRKELNETFDDMKRIRFNHMLNILKTTEGDNMLSSHYSYGITNYYYVFETMVDMLFDGITGDEKKKYDPNGYWQLNGQNRFLASRLRPDTILKRKDKTYILDAKMYQYGATHDRSKLPETQSLQKQITYGDFVSNNLMDKNIRNAFILPYNKLLKSFINDPNAMKYNDSNLVYFGYAYVDWRDDEDFQDYDNIYAFGIDFNYLLNNYKNPDCEIINQFCKVIEENIKSYREQNEIDN